MLGYFLASSSCQATSVESRKLKLLPKKHSYYNYYYPKKKL